MGVSKLFPSPLYQQYPLPGHRMRNQLTRILPLGLGIQLDVSTRLLLGQSLKPPELSIERLSRTCALFYRPNLLYLSFVIAILVGMQLLISEQDAAHGWYGHASRGSQQQNQQQQQHQQGQGQPQANGSDLTRRLHKRGGRSDSGSSSSPGSVDASAKERASTLSHDAAAAILLQDNPMPPRRQHRRGLSGNTIADLEANFDACSYPLDTLVAIPPQALQRVPASRPNTTGRMSDLRPGDLSLDVSPTTLKARPSSAGKRVPVPPLVLSPEPSASVNRQEEETNVAEGTERGATVESGSSSERSIKAIKQRLSAAAEEGKWLAR